MSNDAPPKSVWSRSTRLVKLAAGLAQKELSGRVARVVEHSEAVAEQVKRVRTQVAQAKAIVESLGQLKGAAMKAGQLLSMELRDVLPPEVIEVLSQLQDSGSKVGFDEILGILRDELGSERLAQLEVEAEPIASASIGQVHRALWTRPDGAKLELALKVQFRGIADTIESDLALLQRIAKLFLAVQLKAFDLTGVFDELRLVLTRETDYLLEAEALESYRHQAHQVPGLLVPEVYRELTTKRVLALSFERGLKLEAYLATKPSQAERDRVTHQLLDLYFREFFEWGLVQTDANFANFLFRPERGEVVLLDFGATRSYDATFRERYRRLLTTTIAGDRAGALQVAEALGLIDPRESRQTQIALHELLETVLRIFTPAWQPLDFTDERLVADSAAKLRAFYRELSVAPPPAQLIFLHRKLGGVYSMGKALRAKVELRPYVSRLAP